MIKTASQLECVSDYFPYGDTNESLLVIIPFMQGKSNKEPYANITDSNQMFHPAL